MYRRPKTPRGYVDPQDAMAFLGVSRATFYRWVRLGRVIRRTIPGEHEHWSVFRIEDLRELRADPWIYPR